MNDHQIEKAQEYLTIVREDHKELIVGIACGR